MYTEKVMDHYMNPRNAGDDNDFRAADAVGKVGNPSCGDIMRIYLRVKENKTLTD